MMPTSRTHMIFLIIHKKMQGVHSFANIAEQEKIFRGENNSNPVFSHFSQIKSLICHSKPTTLACHTETTDYNSAVILANVWKKDMTTYWQDQPFEILHATLEQVVKITAPERAISRSTHWNQGGYINFFHHANERIEILISVTLAHGHADAEALVNIAKSLLKDSIYSHLAFRIIDHAATLTSLPVWRERQLKKTGSKKENQRAKTKP